VEVTKLAASIPLPALDSKVPQQPDLLENYSRLAQLSNMLQNAPLQRQAVEQQVEGGQLENQQKQIALKDQQAMTAAMHQWDGKDVNGLIPLVIKNGASANAVMGLKAKVLEQQKTYSDIAASDATTGAKNLETMKGKNDMIAGALGNVMNMPDEQVGQGLVQTAQDLLQKGLIDPQHAQIAAQLAQSGNPAVIRQQLGIMQKGLMSESQQMENALKTAQTQEASSRSNEADVNAQKAQMEMQLGTGPMADSRYRNILMAQKLGRPVTPEDMAFKSAYEHQKMLVPTAQINLQAGLLSQQAKDMAAQNYTETGQLPAGLRSPAIGAQILNTAAKNGPVDVAQNKASYQANAESLKKMQANFDNVTAFENTAGKNLDQFLSTAKSIVDSGSPLINTPLRQVSDKMAGSDKQAAFNAARQTALTEIAKVLSSANAGSGVVSDSARGEVEGLIGPNATLKQIYSAAQILKKDMANRHQAYQQQLNDIKGRMSSAQPQQNNNDPLGIR
jgi:hypothetical protein